MTPELWQRIKSVLEELDETPSPDHAAILNRIATTDPELRREVEPFLSDAGSVTFIQGAIGVQAASLGQVNARQERFGHYQLVKRIGQGGMGAVFEAVRIDDFHKKVALKIIKQGLDSDFARTRFLQERQVLASLEHPNIARLLDGGESDDGSPYLVLEFVDGEPITHYAEKLDRTERLHLFIKVCEAVEYAHRNLIVHRDLKPANILVTANGEPKLLDFGIAKLLDPGGSNTQTGFAALTPEYASPEQVRGEPITTATDVYSLGVILYQMLTGRKPYTLETATVVEMDRIICQQPPAEPGLGDELDYILLMALRKEPQRRYGSVQQFAEDIELYLGNRPVSARPDTLSYRAQKFVRRNWWQMAAVSMVIVSLTAGLGFSIAQQRRADRRFNQVRQLANKFLFDFHDAIANTPGTLKAREMVVSTALEYLNSLAGEAAGDPGLQWEMAVAYSKVALAQGAPAIPSLGKPREAIQSYETAIALARPLADQNRLDGAQKAAFASILSDAQTVPRSIQEYDLALRLGKEAVQRSAGMSSGLQRKVLNELASTMGRAGDLTGSVSTREQLVPLMRETARTEPTFRNRAALASVLVNLGYFQARLTRFTEAKANEMEALQLFQALQAERPEDASIRGHLFNSLYYLGLLEGASDRPSLENPPGAEKRLGEALEVINVAIAADPNDKGSRRNAGLLHNQWASILQESAPQEAIRHAEAALKFLTGTNTEDLMAMRILEANAYRKLGQFPQARNLLDAAGKLARGEDTALELAWARLETDSGNREAAARRFDKAIALNEQVIASLPTPANAWLFAQTLELAAKAVPESAAVRRQRIVAIWTDQDRRLPGHPYIQRQLAQAKARLSDR